MRVTVEMDEEVCQYYLIWSEQFNTQESNALAAALRNAKPAGEAWEPVEDGYQYIDKGTHISGVITTDGDQIINDDLLSGEGIGVRLPDNIRLCRRRTEGA